MRISGLAYLAIGLVLSSESFAHMVPRDPFAVYDTDRNVTWITDASIVSSLGTPGGPTLTKAEADAFVAQFNATIHLYGKSDWRLPKTPLATDSTCMHANRQPTGTVEGFGCKASEIGHVFYTEADWAEPPLIMNPNTLDLWVREATDRRLTLMHRFGINGLESASYWTETDAPTSDGYVFNFFNGFQTTANIAGSQYVLLVRDGDVAPFDFADNGDGTINDNRSGLMWLRDASYSVTVGAGSAGDGFLTWAEAVALADGLTFVGYDDWRLPATPQIDPTCKASATPNVVTRTRCSGSELGALFMKQGISSVTPGPFQNMPTRGRYTWSGTEVALHPTLAFVYSFFWGETGPGLKDGGRLSAWPVRTRLPTDTPTGTGVSVTRDPGVTITFATVTGGGATTVTSSASNPGGNLANFSFLGTYFDIRTTSIHTAPIKVCIAYPLSEDPATLGIAHFSGGAWTRLPTTVEGSQVCASVSSLSWFALGKPSGGGALGLETSLLLLGVLALSLMMKGPRSRFAKQGPLRLARLSGTHYNC